MNARTLMSVDEYRHTRFDGADRDYVDGEVLERSTGELPHARVQGEIAPRTASAGRTPIPADSASAGMDASGLSDVEGDVAAPCSTRGTESGT